MPKYLVLVSSLVAAVILLVMLNFTTPTEIGPFGVLLFFTTLYVLIFGITAAIVKMFVKILNKKMTQKSYLYAAVIALGPIILMLMQSRGQVNLLTLVLALIAVLLGCFLVNKRVI